MTFSIAGLAQEIASMSVKIRGADATIRVLPAKDSRRIRSLFTRPHPPLARNPLAGSAALPVSDERDPKYLAELRGWQDAVMTADVAVALDLATVDGRRWRDARSDEDARAFLSAAAQELLEAMSEAEVAALWGQLQDLAEVTAPRVARDSLLVELAQTELTEAIERFKLPDNYGMTLGYLVLRICERFKMHPSMWDQMDPGLQQLLLQHEKIRQMEEVAAMEARSCG